ncbi:MAG: hypothetical protein WDA37_12320, partial [Dysgonamonadaceae bacterium]
HPHIITSSHQHINTSTHQSFPLITYFLQIVFLEALVNFAKSSYLSQFKNYPSAEMHDKS